MNIIQLDSRQRTLLSPAAFEGTGLHTGEASTMIVRPAAENAGRRFVRADLAGAPEIPALAQNAVEVERGVTLAALGAGGAEARVCTVEHILSALEGVGIDNCVIELSASEPPALDGGARQFVQKLQRAGVTEQKAYRRCLVFSETIRVEDFHRCAVISAEPDEGFCIEARLEYDGLVELSQEAHLSDMRRYADEIAPARTFCLLSEVLALRSAGLIRGGTLQNAVVWRDRPPKSEEETRALSETLGVAPESLQLEPNGVVGGGALRFPNEAARHKILDIIGDVSLAGIPLRARICAARPGHRINVELARKIQRLYERVSAR